MARSYNGWYASPTLKTRVIEPVPSVRLRIVDNNDVATVFDYLVKQFHKRVDDVTKPHPADDWGFAYRPNRNANNLSCHASGTAVDLDATEHPNGVKTSRTFTPKQVAEVHEILAECSGVVRWGGDYTNTADAMHFEIIKGAAAVAAAARKIKALLAAAKRKPLNTIAKEVIAGRWGNGPTRIVRLQRAGYNYLRVMAEVRRLMGVASTPVRRKTVQQIAVEVIAGKWGNGPTRIRRLKAAGYDPAAVQRAVNKLL